MRLRHFIALLVVFWLANTACASPAALPADNLLACSWFRESPTPYDPPHGSVCNEWFRDNNTGGDQAPEIPSPTENGGTAQQFKRDTSATDQGRLWQVVESTGGLQLRFSAYTRLNDGDDLTVNIYGRDEQYGSGAWTLIWTPAQLVGGDGMWHDSGQLTYAAERPYRFYMVEIVGHVPGEIGSRGAALTGVYFAVDGGSFYLPTVINRATTTPVPEGYP